MSPNPVDAAVSLVQRYVIFSHTRGIRLEAGLWTNDPAAATAVAVPTYTGDAAAALIREESALTPDQRPHARPVHADRPHGMASREACANAGLPRWGADAPVLGA